MFDAGKVAKALLAASVFIQQTGAASVYAQGLPTGGSVSSGSASISSGGGTMTVTQTSPTAIVNWNSFSIGQPNSVTFNQPGVSSAILNRVTGNTPSSIAGQLNANGQVFLVNPNGIAITPTGTVNVGGGFVASTLAISDEEFRRGQHRFVGNGASAGVTNEGAIAIGRGGYAALIGGTVSNTGKIAVPLGKVGLASGERVTLDVAGDGFLQVALPTNSRTGAALIEQKGQISAPGGRVVIDAATARDAARQAVNLSGVTEAKTIGGRTGAIVIGGGEGGAVSVSGTVDAGGGGGTGGRVAVTGQQVTLKGAKIDVSGDKGGGNVAIGGGQRGGGPLPQAEKVTIDAASRIDADARDRGTGGSVVVWSSQSTAFSGLIGSRGGRSGGDGGQVEVSSKGQLGFTGLVVLTAAQGEAGTLLLDPGDLYIANAGGATAAPAGWSVIDSGLLQTQLAMGNVVLETASGSGGLGNITLAAGSQVAWSSASRLTLQADNSITLGGTIAAPNGALSLQAVGSITDTAATSISANSIDASASYVKSCRHLAGQWRCVEHRGPGGRAGVGDREPVERCGARRVGEFAVGWRLRSGVGSGRGARSGGSRWHGLDQWRRGDDPAGRHDRRQRHDGRRQRRAGRHQGRADGDAEPDGRCGVDPQRRCHRTGRGRTDHLVVAGQHLVPWKARRAGRPRRRQWRHDRGVGGPRAHPAAGLRRQLRCRGARAGVGQRVHRDRSGQHRDRRRHGAVRHLPRPAHQHRRRQLDGPAGHRPGVEFPIRLFHGAQQHLCVDRGPRRFEFSRQRVSLQPVDGGMDGPGDDARASRSPAWGRIPNSAGPRRSTAPMR